MLKYWDFTLTTIALNDIPTMTKYILAQTNKSNMLNSSYQVFNNFSIIRNSVSDCLLPGLLHTY